MTRLERLRYMAYLNWCGRGRPAYDDWTDWFHAERIILSYSHTDLTLASGAPPVAAGNPMGYMGDVPRVVYGSENSHIHEIAINPQSRTWGHLDLTAATGAPGSDGYPMGYMGDVPRVVYGSWDSHIHEIAINPQSGTWRHFDLTAATGAPGHYGSPMGYMGQVPRTVFWGIDNHIHEIIHKIATNRQSETWDHFDLTAATGAPGNFGYYPMGYMGEVPRVVYGSQDAHIHEIAINPQSGTWRHFDLTAATGAPLANSNPDPMGYIGEVPRVVYRGQDAHIHEIAINPQSGTWRHFDLMAATGAPVTLGRPMGYMGDVPRVVYRGQDAHIHEIAINPQSGTWRHFDLTAATGAPLADSDPMGYIGEIPRVVYRGQDAHIHEIAINGAF
ncbi:MAG: hypothetical protein KF751_15360 [Nitrospira sp.]|nr:hypothetical protein [Nitrospira sp.]